MSTEIENKDLTSNDAKPMLGEDGRIKHTLENCFFAMNDLIKRGFLKEDDIYFEDNFDYDYDYEGMYGFFKEEPLVKNQSENPYDDSEPNPCFNLWYSLEYGEEDANNMVDYFIENGLI